MAENFWSVNISTVIGWIVIIVGTIVFIIRLESKTKENAEAIKELKDDGKKAPELLARITTLEAKMGLFWAVMEKHAATILHHPTMYERDKLIDGYLAGTLTAEQLQEFVHLLDGIVHNNAETSGERLAASMLLLAIHHRHGLAVGLAR